MAKPIPPPPAGFKPFLDDDFLLENECSAALYHQYAAALPIIDYHNHLPPQEIAQDRRFGNIAQAWLAGDHYKWRAMRANGVDEYFITGEANDWEKFEKWAETVPYTLRNPLYHWTHLELRRYFGVDALLRKETAREVFDECNRLLATPAFSVKNLLLQRNVEVVCTTDDPTDDLRWHRQALHDGFDIKVLPTFRPDPLLSIGNPNFDLYIEALDSIAATGIESLHDLLHALQSRVDFFHANGCRLSDHGLSRLPLAHFTETKADAAFRRRLQGETLDPDAVATFQSAILFHLGKMYHAKGWVQQFHLGPLRNQNTRLLRLLGPDTGFDSIGDFPQAEALGLFLDHLDRENRLPKTILYNLNPRDNEVFASMAGNFNDGTTPGKVQYGAAWWFLDQLDGMEKQLDTLSNMGLLSRSVGMLTDSRSFLSFPRHEYFRRLLCNILGRDVQRGRLPYDLPFIGKLVQDICYFNAKNYFAF